MRFPLILIAVLTSSAIYAQEPRTVQLKVTEVLDGSTVRGLYKIPGEMGSKDFRLFGIQAPIKDEERLIEQPHWKESKIELGKMVVGKTIKAVRYDFNGDGYWSLVDPDGKNINLQMVRLGFAWHHPAHGPFPKFALAQQQAKGAKKGLWGLDELPLEPWKYEKFLEDDAVRRVAEGSKLPDDPTAKQTLEIIAQAAAEADLVTLWDGLPEEYQDDIKSMVQQYANSLDAQSWNDMTSLLRKTSTVFRDKKDYFLNNPRVSEILPKERVEAIKIWNAIIALLDLIASCSLTDQTTMKGLTVDDFVTNDLPKIQAVSSKLCELLEASYGPLPFELQTVEVVDAAKKEVRLRTTTVDGENRVERWVKVDRRWLPGRWIDGWDEGLKQARASITNMFKRESREPGDGSFLNIPSPGVAFNLMIDQLLAADSQEAFDRTFQAFFFRP